MRPATATLTPLITATAAFATTVAARVLALDGLSSARRETALSRDVITSPGPKALNLLSIQHASAVAELVWLQIVQNLGANEASLPAVADRLERWSEIASDLDPEYFEVQYYPAVVLTMYSRRTDASDRLAKKGARNLPERWEFPFLLGYNAYFVHGKPDDASSYWLQSAHLPNVPRYVPSLVARSKLHAGNPEEALSLLESMLEWLPPGPHREDAEIRIAIIKSELYILPKYDQACASMRAQTGKVPTAEELFTAGLVVEPPRDLLGGEIELDENCRARTKVINVREDEAAKRVGSRPEVDDPSIRAIQP